MDDTKVRMAKCRYFGKSNKEEYEEGRTTKKFPQNKCNSMSPSSNRENLAFFSSNTKEDFDEYYCGCMGWD